MKLSIFKKKKQTENTRAFSAQGGVFHRIGRDAVLDWSWIFSLGIIITIAGLLWGLRSYIYTGDKFSDTTAVTGSAVSKLFDENALDVVVRTFDAHTAEREAVRRGYNGPADPSL